MNSKMCVHIKWWNFEMYRWLRSVFHIAMWFEATFTLILCISTFPSIPKPHSDVAVFVIFALITFNITNETFPSILAVLVFWEKAILPKMHTASRQKSSNVLLYSMNMWCTHPKTCNHENSRRKKIMIFAVCYLPLKFSGGIFDASKRRTEWMANCKCVSVKE